MTFWNNLDFFFFTLEIASPIHPPLSPCGRVVYNISILSLLSF